MVILHTVGPALDVGALHFTVTFELSAEEPDETQESRGILDKIDDIDVSIKARDHDSMINIKY